MKEKELNSRQELLKLGDDFDIISYYVSIEKERKQRKERLDKVSALFILDKIAFGLFTLIFLFQPFNFFLNPSETFSDNFFLNLFFLILNLVVFFTYIIKALDYEGVFFAKCFDSFYKKMKKKNKNRIKTIRHNKKKIDELSARKDDYQISENNYDIYYRCLLNHYKNDTINDLPSEIVNGIIRANKKYSQIKSKEEIINEAKIEKECFLENI